MKTRKNLILLVLLSLFVSVGVADSNVTDVNLSKAESPWGDISEVTEALAEAKKASAENEAAKAELEKAKAENEAVKQAALAH